ncbi:MAG TPA: polysaccharide deacetylase family protein, partial [Chitinophagales bacterium]|nr:polysaccharide deacetylase family protein [Chitinophagales bacterium]
MGIEITLTTDQNAFAASTLPKLNYSNKPIADELFFYAAPLLFERGIKPQTFKIERYRDTVIFYIAKNSSDLPFDLFAATFYLITRYEEYLPHKTDQHGRYPAEESLAYHEQFLHQPVIDIWAHWLWAILLRYYPQLPVTKRGYRFIPTYDIDLAYAYANKGLLRSIGGYLQDARLLNYQAILERTKVLLRLKTDPFDTFNWQFELQKKYRFKPVYFILLCEYAQFDKNISFENLQFQELICRIADFSEVGIHPSYNSNKDVRILQAETTNLEFVLRKEIKRSRQHYIKLHLPNTYQNLIELAINKDYTMGYPQKPGFRASTCSSFFFYDLTLEMETKLKIFPFTVMDVTLQQYQQLKPDQAFAAVLPLIEQVKAVNGIFSTIWHNHTLSNRNEWQGWRDVY